MNVRWDRPWLMTGMASLVILAVYVTIFAVPPLITTLVSDLGITHEEAGLLMSAYLLVYCLGSLVTGILSDRLGARPVMASGLILASIAGFFFANTTLYPLMLVSRLIIGWGAASIYAPGMKFVLDWLPAKRATTGLAWYNMALAVGSAVPMLLTPILIIPYGWVWPVRFYALFGIVVAVLFWMFTSERKQPKSGSATPIPGTAQAGENLFRNPVLILTCLALFLAFIHLYGIYTWVPPYLGEVLRLSPAEIGIGTLALTFSAVPASIFVGWLADKTGKRMAITIGGSVVAATSIFLITLVGAPFWVVVTVCFIVGWGIVMTVIPLFAVAGAAVAPAQVGRAMGLASAWAYAGGILSTYWGGYAVANLGGYDTAFVTFTVGVLASGILICPFVARALSRASPLASPFVSGDRV